MNFLLSSGLIIPLVFFLLFFFVLGFITESRNWNKGICKESGLPWKWFDTDSQGGRGYFDGTTNYCWVSYPMIDKVLA